MSFDVNLNPSDDIQRQRLAAARDGEVVTIHQGLFGPTLPSDRNALLRVYGPCDRLLIMFSDLRPVRGADVTTWPAAEVSFALVVGNTCALDRRKYLSGIVPDVATFVSATDTRTGVLYEAQNFLASQWVLYAAVAPSTGSDWTGTISILADCKGGGGEPFVYQGGIFVPP